MKSDPGNQDTLGSQPGLSQLMDLSQLPSLKSTQNAGDSQQLDYVYPQLNSQELNLFPTSNLISSQQDPECPNFGELPIPDADVPIFSAPPPASILENLPWRMPPAAGIDSNSVFLPGVFSMLGKAFDTLVQQEGMDTQPAGVHPKPTHPSLLKAEHKHSRAVKRGPMDEMRQLVRILVKLIPGSIVFLWVHEEGGSGNRVSEEQIKEYLKTMLGSDAPHPEWGLPTGWGQYLSELFTWAMGRDVSREEAMKTARRLPGRSWEAVQEEIDAQGLFTYCWPVPLSQEGIRKAIEKHKESLPELPATYLKKEAAIVKEAPLLARVAVGPKMHGAEADAVAILSSLHRSPTAQTASDIMKKRKSPIALIHSAPLKMPASLPWASGSQLLAQNLSHVGQDLHTQDGSPNHAQFLGSSLHSILAPTPSSPAPSNHSPHPAVQTPGEMSELEIWHLLLFYAQAADAKRGTTRSEDLGDLFFTRDLVKKIVSKPLVQTKLPLPLFSSPHGLQSQAQQQAAQQQLPISKLLDTQLPTHPQQQSVGGSLNLPIQVSTSSSPKSCANGHTESLAAVPQNLQQSSENPQVPGVLPSAQSLCDDADTKPPAGALASPVVSTATAEAETLISTAQQSNQQREAAAHKREQPVPGQPSSDSREQKTSAGNTDVAVSILSTEGDEQKAAATLASLASQGDQERSAQGTSESIKSDIDLAPSSATKDVPSNLQGTSAENNESVT